MNLKKFPQFLFYLLVFLIPCNLAKHWPQGWSYVSGISVDYLIPTLYLTDILILILFGTWLIEKLNSKPKVKKYKSVYLISGLIIFVFINILLAKNQLAAALKWLKLAEMGFLVFWIKTQLKSTNTLDQLTKVLSLSVIWQSILAIIQWLKQGSVFGYLNFGEQPYSSATLGIKKISFFGQVKVLPMGTFSHPNVLAGFLMVSLMIILSTKINKPKSLITKLALVLGILALGLTFSFPSWLAFLIFAIWYVKAGPLHWSQITGVFVKARPLHWRFLLGLVMLVLVFVYGLKALEPTSFLIRIKLLGIAFRMWVSSPLFGVGLNNFIVRLEEFGRIVVNYRFLQPVHNIFFLILAESGIVGLSLTIFILFLVFQKSVKNKNSSFLFPLCSLLFLGLFDHYWLTIQQGSLILSLALGLSLRVSTTTRKSN